MNGGSVRTHCVVIRARSIIGYRVSYTRGHARTHIRNKRARQMLFRVTAVAHCFLINTYTHVRVVPRVSGRAFTRVWPSAGCGRYANAARRALSSAAVSRALPFYCSAAFFRAAGPGKSARGRGKRSNPTPTCAVAPRPRRAVGRFFVPTRLLVTFWDRSGDHRGGSRCVP